MTDISEGNSTLYIGDLHTSVTEKILFDKFMKFGKLLYVHISKDYTSQKSLGHGYIVFSKHHEAQKALQEMNLIDIFGQPCRLMWFEKDLSKRKFGAGNIVIKNLGKSVTAREIHDKFVIFGKITSCKINSDEHGTFTGIAFVNYQSENDALNAISSMNQKYFKDNIIGVEKYNLNERISKDQSPDCYIDNLLASFDESDLRCMFEKFGVVVIAKIMYNADGTSKGFGFVKFKECDDAVKATLDLNGTEFQNKIVHVYQVIKKKDASGCNLYVTNLSDKINDERLRNLFRGFGKIISAKVILNNYTLKPIGFGFVAFLNREDGDNALRALNGKPIDGKILHVSYKKTQVNDYHQQTFSNIRPPELPIDLPVNHQNILNPLIAQNTATLYRPSPCQKRNFMRMPILNPTISNNASTACSKNLRPKQMLEKKIIDVVNNYAGDRSSLIMNKLLKLGVDRLFNVSDCEEVIRVRVQQLMENFDNESCYSSTIGNMSTNSIEDEMNVIEVNPISGASDDEDTKLWFANKDEKIEEYNDVEQMYGSCDDNNDVKTKRTLCYKLYNAVENPADTTAKDVIKELMKLSKAELLFMAKHDEYLQSKIEVIKNELKDQDGLVSELDDLKSSSCDWKSEPDEDIRKQSLAIKIYPLVIKHAGSMSGRITDKFMQLDCAELRYMLDNEDYMRMKIDMILSQGQGTSGNKCRGSTRSINSDVLKDDTLMSEIQDALTAIESGKCNGGTDRS